MGKKYNDYPQGFEKLCKDMKIDGMDNVEKKKAVVWGLVEMLIGS